MKCSFLYCTNKEVAKWPLLVLKLMTLHCYPVICGVRQIAQCRLLLVLLIRGATGIAMALIN